MKKKTPPFEVMRTRVNQPARSYAPTATSQEATASPRSLPADASRDASVDGDWLSQARQPFVLRLPRGQAAAIVGAMLLLIVLAYGVGHTRGVRIGEEAVRSQMGELSEAVPLLPEDAGRSGSGSPTLTVGSGTGTATISNGTRTTMAQASPEHGSGSAQFVSSGQAAEANQGASIRRASADPREPGLNYFVLAHYPIEDAARLKKFLEQQGVPCVILSTGRSDQYQVQALNGFLREELDSREFNVFREKLIRLGFIWKREHRGPTDLSGAYPQLFKPSS